MAHVIKADVSAHWAMRQALASIRGKGRAKSAMVAQSPLTTRTWRKRYAYSGNYGSQIKYHNEVKGYNSRLDELQAAFMRAKLEKLDEWDDRRKQIAADYLQKMAGCNLVLSPFLSPASLLQVAILLCCAVGSAAWAAPASRPRDRNGGCDHGFHRGSPLRRDWRLPLAIAPDAAAIDKPAQRGKPRPPPTGCAAGAPAPRARRAGAAPARG